MIILQIKSRSISLLFFSLVLLTAIEPTYGSVQDLDGTLKMVQPVSNNTYKNIIYVDFTVDWTIRHYYIPWIGVVYSYTIDDGNLTPIPGPNNTTQAYTINFNHAPPDSVSHSVNFRANISGLADGRHKITIYTSELINMDNLGFKQSNHSFPATYFQVYNPEPTTISNSADNANAVPIPPQENDYLLVGAIIIIISIAIITKLLYYKRHRQKGLDVFQNAYNWPAIMTVWVHVPKNYFTLRLG